MMVQIGLLINGLIMELLYLGDVAPVITKFRTKPYGADVLVNTPTLSPNDPKFAEWYEKVYKPILRKFQGVEPEGH